MTKGRKLYYKVADTRGAQAPQGDFPRDSSSTGLQNKVATNMGEGVRHGKQPGCAAPQSPLHFPEAVHEHVQG